MGKNPLLIRTKVFIQGEEVMKKEIVETIPSIIDTFDKTKLSTKIMLTAIFVATAIILIFVYILSK